MKTMKFIQQLGLSESISPIVFIDFMGENDFDFFYYTKITTDEIAHEIAIELSSNKVSTLATNVSLFVKLTDIISEMGVIPNIYLTHGKRLYKIANVEQSTSICSIHITKIA